MIDLLNLNAKQADGVARIYDSLCTAAILTLVASIFGHAKMLHMYEVILLIPVIVGLIFVSLHLRKEI